MINNQSVYDSIQRTYGNHKYNLTNPILYGTAGFRTNAIVLDSVMYTVGILGALRSLATHSTVGIMITASHNEVQDNGVKLIDPSGEMLTQSWEVHATDLANASNADELIHQVNEIVNKYQIDLSIVPSVNVGYDTRPHSVPLTQSVLSGIQCFTHSIITNYGLVTTPQLHYMVYLNNTTSRTVQLSDYYTHFSSAYRRMLATTGAKQQQQRRIVVDCAFGIGGKAIREMNNHLSDLIEFSVINDSSDDDDNGSQLNRNCGAEYVQKQKRFPVHHDGHSVAATVDGDADRIVYFYGSTELQLIDGDKMATLFAQFIDEQLSFVGLADELQLGIVQTAYANGSSTKYLKSKVKKPENISCVATGVKHLHHKAKEYDIAIYFEANGHGTVLFSERAKSLIQSLPRSSESSERTMASERLKAALELINPAVGDAICDLLFSEAILAMYGMDYVQWNQLYTDFPSVQTKVIVRDRTLVKTSTDETRVLEPVGLQDRLDELMEGGKDDKRTFVRPSGTEDCVRVYAEANSQDTAQRLAADVELVIKQFL